MYFDEESIKNLAKQTQTPATVCCALMKKYGFNEQIVRAHITKRKENWLYMIFDNLTLYLGGEMGYKIRVSNGEHTVLDVSVIFLLLLFFLFPLPTFSIGLIFLLLIITNTRFELYNDNDEQQWQKTFTKRQSQAKRTPVTKETGTNIEQIEGENGFYGIKIK